MTDAEPLARLQDEKARLYELLDGDPVAAVADAQKLQVPGAPVELINQVQAMIFIDGGQAHVEHFDLMDFEDRTLNALKIARAAILYLAEAISICEAHKASKNEAIYSLEVPSHHWVRGETDE